MDPYKIILKPDVTEKSMKLVESENKLVFVVSRNASKSEIRDSIEKLYEVEVEDVNTLISARGFKKAFVKLGGKHKADEVAIRIGIF